MNSIQQQPGSFHGKSDSSSRPPRRAIFICFAISTLVIAIIWGLSDGGQIGSLWGKLAFVFFTWVAVVVAAWTLLREKE